MNASKKILGISLSAIGLTLLGCNSASQPQTNAGKSNGSSLAAYAVPKPPSNQLSGKGFGLDDTSGGGTTTPASSTSNSSGTAASTDSTTAPVMPKGALAAQGGGWWAAPESTVSPQVGSSGYLQYYDGKTGTATEWLGKPGTGTTANNFSMMKYDGTAGALDTSQQFVAQKSTNGWLSGQILGADGKPYQYTGAEGTVITSAGYTVNGSNQQIYSWNASNAAQQKPALIKTTGYNLPLLFSSGTNVLGPNDQVIQYPGLGTQQMPPNYVMQNNSPGSIQAVNLARGLAGIFAQMNGNGGN